jgi:hypothetical protein
MLDRHRLAVTLCVALVLAAPQALAAQTPPAEWPAAVQAFQAGDFAEAIVVLETITESSPDFPNAWLLLGRAYLGNGQTEQARGMFARARSFEAVEWQAVYFEGLSWAEDGDLDAAFEALEQAKQSGSVNLTNIGLAPQASALREDPRYASLFPSKEEYADPFLEDVRILHDWVGEAAGDQFGWIARNVGDVDEDGIMDATVSAPTWGGGKGKIYLYSGRSGELLWTAEGREGDQLGFGVDAAGDADGDGVPDVAGGAPGGGRVHIWSGRDGRVILTITDAEDISFGQSLVDVGDLDSDGHDDLLVGAPGAGSGAGLARVYSGADGHVLWEHRGQDGHSFGSAVGGWAFEGQPFLVVGAPGAGGNQGGVTYVFRGLAPEPAFRIEAEDTGAQNGAMFVSVLGDVDGDGTADVYSSDWSDGAEGAQTGRIYVHSGATGERLYALGGETAGDGFGIGVADAGDVDGDGLADLVVGAWQHGSQAISGGKVYVYSGKNGSLLYTITGTVPGETFGFDATGLGDVDGDGITDFLLTSAWSGINGTRSGRTLVVAGRGR